MMTDAVYAMDDHTNLQKQMDVDLGVDGRHRVDHDINLMDDVSGSDEDAVRFTVNNSQVNTSASSTSRHIYVQCDCNKLKTPVGWLKMLSLVSCIVSLLCLIIVDFPSFPMPLSLRLFVFSLVFTFLSTLLLFVLEITSVYRIFSVPWEKWNAVVHIVLSILMNGSSSIVVHSIIEHHLEVPLPPKVLHIIIIASVAGYLCGMFSMFLGLTSCFCYNHHLKSSWKNPRQDGFMMVQQS